MKILAIETSCDETGAAVVENGVRILSNVVASSLALHVKTGGIVPEIAAREQLRSMTPVITKAITDAARISNFQFSISNQSDNDKIIKWAKQNIDSLAVTCGPGLIGSLLVGVETAKTLAYAWNKPIIPVNHLIGHIYANWIANHLPGVPRAQHHLEGVMIQFPCLALIVSGGHTDLVLMTGHGKFRWLGGTRDDAAGEAFDKIGRLLGLGYPGGPSIAQSAMEFKISNLKFQIELPRPMIEEENFDFSFSGLKTAVLREVNKLKTSKQFNNVAIQQLAYEVQQAIVDVLVAKTLKAARKFKVKSILLGGGVAANDLLREELKLNARRYSLNAAIFVPQKSLCTDNAAMIGAAAFFNNNPVSWNKVKVDSNLHFC